MLAAKLRKRKESWRKVRWWGLIGGAINVVGGSWMLERVLHMGTETEQWDVGLVWISPLCWFFFFQGIYVLTRTTIKWKGDVTEELLLHLLDRQDAAEKEGNKKTSQ